MQDDRKILKSFTAEAQRTQSEFFFCLQGDGRRLKEAHYMIWFWKPCLIARARSIYPQSRIPRKVG